MKRLSTKGKRIAKRVMTFFICVSLLISMPGAIPVVSATEVENSEEAKTETAETTENENADPNGKLGKNSDVGIEVTKSITGTAGKKVKVAFKLKSSDTSKIKLKSVYPVIDADFPFETSGDAYKVENAGKDEDKQKALNVTFSMTARSDLETGYHSVRFIGEYTKAASDGSEKDYYVIKTINIYFKGADSVSRPSAPSVDKGDDDDEISPSFPEDDGDDRGYSGGSSDEEATAPKLLITGYETKPEKIMSGETFKLKIHIKNTSKSTSVCNAKFLIGNEAGSFLPTSGSSAVFLESIPAGETGDLEIEMKTAADLAQKNYILVVKGDFDDGRGNNFTSSDNLSLPVYQEVKMGISDVTMMPEILGVNEQGSLTFTMNNKTNVGIYNVKVTVDDEAATAEECYVGNIAGASTAYATLALTGVKDNSETGTINVIISYEDAEGTVGTIEEKISCSVSADGSSGEPGDAEDGLGELDQEMENEEDGMAWWLILLIILLVLGIIAGIIVFVVIRKKKNAELLDFDDDDDFGEEDIENEDF